MIDKIIKYMASYLRLIFLKIKHGKKLDCKVNSVKSVYVGKGVRIKINPGCKLVLGDRIYLSDYCKIECLSGNVAIGNGTFFNDSCKIICFEKINIGNECLFGPNVSIYDHDHRFDINDMLINKQGYTKKCVEIKNNIWVGANSVITKGCIINNRVVIGANSLVKGVVKAEGVYGGVPIKLIKVIDK